MAMYKCIALPPQGHFEVGQYYIGRIQKQIIIKDAEDREFSFPLEKKTIFGFNKKKPFFREVQIADVSLSVYLDNKKALVFVPGIKHEVGYGVSLNEYEILNFPYTMEAVGEMLLKVFDTYRMHPIMRADEPKPSPAYYELITNGKGYQYFAKNHWLVMVSFMLSENEMCLEYWYKKERGAFGIDKSDKQINKVIPFSASYEEIGQAVMAIFEEAGVLALLDKRKGMMSRK